MAFSGALVIPAGKVAADLPGFVVRLDLSDLPVSWWDETTSDGGNLRLFDAASTPLPVDVVWIDKGTRSGEAFFRADLLATVDNVFEVAAIDGGTMPAVTDPIGRNAVWADYTAFFSFYSLVDRTGSGNDATLLGTGVLADGWLDCGYATGAAIATNLPRATDWTAGITLVQYDDPGSANQTVLTYTDLDSATDSHRETLSHDSGNRPGLWNSSNGWIYGPTITEFPARRREHAVKNQTGNDRAIWIDGVFGASEGSTARPTGSGLTTLYIGQDDASGGSRLRGKVTHVYLRPGVLSGDWLAAEYASWEGVDFYTPPVDPLPPVGTETRTTDDRLRDAVAYATWDPPVVEPPVTTTAPVHDYVSVNAYTGFDTTSGAPALTGLTRVETPRHRHRIVVAGRDVTFFRGSATPHPTYSLISPLMYGSGSIEFPQVHAAFERPGHGDLSWLKPFAPVRVERVNAAGARVGVDFRGFLLDAQVRGRTLTFGLVGEATGRAALDYRPPRIFRRRNDLGWWWYHLLGQLRVQRGPKRNTDIVLDNRGDMSLLDYANQLSAEGINRDGTQWTVMPGASGVYRTARKDVATIAGTVYFDDAHTVADLRRDPAEEPNTIYATGVSPDGRRIRFADYPALQLRPQDVPPFPNTGGRRIVRGDTDADTDSGGGVTALTSRLWQVGYLDLDQRGGRFDYQTERAVKDLQDDAGLLVNGEVGPGTWEAMFDFAVTGYTIRNAQMRPAAQHKDLRRYRRTPSGAILGRNPDFDPNKFQIARAIDVGPGFTQGQVRDFARSEIHSGNTPNWVGTITFNTGALVRAAVAPGSPLDAFDVMDARELRPGMNLWAPLYDGGTVLHVSGVEVGVGDGGRPTVSVSVDTRARDTMEVWEVIARNRESRRSPARQWVREFRSSIMNKDRVLEWDAVGGTTPDVELEGLRWNVFPVVAGQEGTIARLRMKVSPSREFVVAVFGRRVGRGLLGKVIGNPLTKAGSERWTDITTDEAGDLRYEKLMLYVAGDDASPCGYFPRDKGDGGSPTGRWEDDAGFGYRTFDDYSLWVAVFPGGDCTLKGGRIMWNQLDPGT